MKLLPLKDLLKAFRLFMTLKSIAPPIASPNFNFPFRRLIVENESHKKSLNNKN